MPMKSSEDIESRQIGSYLGTDNFKDWNIYSEL